MRLFLAINVPHDVRRELVAATAALRECAPEVAWVTEPLIHLTLKFLGEQPPERVRTIQDALAMTVGRHRELVMSLGGIGAFPNFRRARIVWIGVAPNARLELLHHDIELACADLGFELEARPFRPHLTLGRVKREMSEDQLRALARTARQVDYRSDCIVRSVDLMESVLSSAGSAYATLVSAALRGD